VIRLINVVGARPQFIKLGPIQRAITAANQEGAAPVIEELVAHTGQHYDAAMSDRFFSELELRPPDVNLGVGSGSHGVQTAAMLTGLEQMFAAEQPDLVVTYGDTNSTLAGALAASKLNVPVAHVEAGLRSFNRRMPEEINRILTDQISDLLFCPTETGVQNLANEGVRDGVFLTGDVMCDSVHFNLELARRRSDAIGRHSLTPGAYVLATIHRAENTDDPARLNAIVDALETIAAEHPVVLPLHPRTQAALAAAARTLARVQVIEPVGYLDMILLEAEARAIVTDSGGVQKEACLHGVPCVTVRDETEWTETVETGWNLIAGADPERIVQATLELPHARGPSPYGVGDAATQIVQIIRRSQWQWSRQHTSAWRQPGPRSRRRFQPAAPGAAPPRSRPEPRARTAPG